MLGNLNLPQQLSQRGTIPGSVLSGDSNLLSSLCHFVGLEVYKEEYVIEDLVTNKEKVQKSKEAREERRKAS